MTILSLTKVDVGMMEDVGTSDPTISTNPGTVGKLYTITTDGEIFICTDATADANTWTNVGAGTGYGGVNYGFCAGGDGTGY